MDKIEGIRFILFDVDNTLVYGGRAEKFYKLYSRVLERTLAENLGVSLSEGVSIANQFRQKRDGRGEAAFIELGLGLIPYYDAIVQLKPKSFFIETPKVSKILKNLQSRGYGMGAVTDSPTILSRKIMKAVGIKQEYFDPFIGWERDSGLPKGGESKVFLEITRRLDLNPKEILVVGDSLGTDIRPALEVGLRTAHISNKKELQAQFTVKNIEELEKLLV